MQLTLENTTKGVINLGALKLEPGDNELTPEQLKAWRALRATGTSKELLRQRKPRWPAKIVEMMSNGWIKVKKVTGADDRDARRKRKPTAATSSPSPMRSFASSSDSSKSDK